MASGAFINRAIFTPTQFPAMAAHMQTEALLLANEMGLQPDVVAASIELPPSAVRAIMRARHAYQLPAAAAAEKEIAVCRPSNRHRIAAMLLNMGATERAVRLSVTAVMSSLDIGNASATRALRQMLADKWIIRSEPSSPIEAAAYVLTEIGAVAAGEAT